MFGQVRGLPVHALVVHGAVVLVPLTCLLALGMAVPRWQRVVRWPLVACAAISVALLWVAKESGETLQRVLGDQLAGNATGKLVSSHAVWADRLLIAAIALLAVAILAAIVFSRGPMTIVRVGVAALLIVAACATVWLTVMTGEEGAKARWNPDGSMSYTG